MDIDENAIDDQAREQWIRRISTMDQVYMAKLVRFAKVGHPVFYGPNDLSKAFFDRFDSLGGMTPSISKMIGWSR